MQLAICTTLERSKPPQIRISPGSDDLSADSGTTFGTPVVQIMVDSPKEPPRGDFSNSDFENTSTVVEEQPTSDLPETTNNIDINTPIDVNVQGDTSKVFYDYNPEEANEIIVLETLTEESPKSEENSIVSPPLPEIPALSSISSSSSSSAAAMNSSSDR